MSEYVHGYATDEQERSCFDGPKPLRDELILPGTTLAPGTRLLEVGCGVGAVLGILGGSFPGVALAGVDIEERQIEAGRGGSPVSVSKRTCTSPTRSSSRTRMRRSTTYG